MLFGKPRTESERIERHKTLYGAESTPPAVRRGMGPSMSTFSEVIYSWMPLSPIGPGGKFQLPIPRWLTVKMKGAGRRLP